MMQGVHSIQQFYKFHQQLAEDCQKEKPSSVLEIPSAYHDQSMHFLLVGRFFQTLSFEGCESVILAEVS